MSLKTEMRPIHFICFCLVVVLIAETAMGGSMAVAGQTIDRIDIPDQRGFQNPVRLAQVKKPIKPQFKITGGDNSLEDQNDDSSGAPKLSPSMPDGKARGEKSDAAKTWEIISATKDPAVLDRFIAKYPGTIQAALAAQKKGELARAVPVIEAQPAKRSSVDKPKQEPEKKISVVEPDQEPANLVLEIQNELRRVGCDPGEPDGKWGGKSTRAAEQFGRHTGLEADTSRANLRLLANIQTRRERVCPVTCGAGTFLADGQCVAKTCPRGQRLSSNGECYRVKTAKTCKKGQKLSSKGRCYTPKARKTTTRQSCRRGERLSSRGVCYVPRRQAAKTSKRVKTGKRQCSWCERRDGRTDYICGRKRIQRARARGNCR